MFDLATEEVKKTRYKECIFCPELRNGLVLTRGKLGKKTDKTCGCIIEAKIQFENQKCPQNKW